MDMSTGQIMHEAICKELTELYVRKNHDYGDSFHKSFQDFGEVMCAIRMTDKLNRFVALIGKEQMVNDESLEDTVKDLANYAIMTLMEMRQENRSGDR